MMYYSPRLLNELYFDVDVVPFLRLVYTRGRSTDSPRRPLLPPVAR